MSDNNYTAAQIKDFYEEKYLEILEDASIEAVQYVIDVYGLSTEQVWDALEGIEPTYDEDDDD